MRRDFPSEMSLRRGLINESRLGSRLSSFSHAALCHCESHRTDHRSALSQAKCSFLVVVSGRLRNPEGVFVETLFVDVKLYMEIGSL
jgi:hypothetical protein